MPDAAIVIEDVAELLPWQLRGKAGPDRRVLKTFMFTDIVGSTNLVEAMGDEAWDTLLRWHDATLRVGLRRPRGEEVSTTGDGFFVSFDSPDAASPRRSRSSAGSPSTASSTASRRRSGSGCTPRTPTQVGDELPRQGRPRGGADRRAGRGRRDRRELPRSGAHYPTSGRGASTLKGISEPIEVVTIDWR